MSELETFIVSMSEEQARKIVNVFVEKMCEYETEDFVKRFIESSLSYVKVIPEKGKSYDCVDIRVMGSVRSY